jgi:hypothetical protein
LEQRRSQLWTRFEQTRHHFFGFKLHLLVTLSGVIVDFELAPANESDLSVGIEMLEQHTDLEVVGDKAFISAQCPILVYTATWPG